MSDQKKYDWVLFRQKWDRCATHPLTLSLCKNKRNPFLVVGHTINSGFPTKLIQENKDAMDTWLDNYYLTLQSQVDAADTITLSRLWKDMIKFYMLQCDINKMQLDRWETLQFLFLSVFTCRSVVSGEPIEPIIKNIVDTKELPIDSRKEFTAEYQALWDKLNVNLTILSKEKYPNYKDKITNPEELSGKRNLVELMRVIFTKLPEEVFIQFSPLIDDWVANLVFNDPEAMCLPWLNAYYLYRTLINQLTPDQATELECIFYSQL